MIFDTHCHYNMSPLLDNWQAHWQRAHQHGVRRSVVVGTDLDSSHQALLLTKQEPTFRAAVAIHPSEYQSAVEDQQLTVDAGTALITQQLAQLQQLCQDTHVVAIGETGLDYFRLPDNQIQAETIKDVQKMAFSTHLKLADQAQMPVIIHVRDRGEAAYADILQLIKLHASQTQPFILHCVSGPLEYIEAALELGAYLGIAGNITYKSAEHIRSLVRYAPADRLLLETDAPFLPPQEFRGKVCEPWMIQLTAEFVQDELSLAVDQLYHNATQVFGF